MPIVHINQSQTGQFTANAADTKWIIDPGVAIQSDGDFCFSSGFANTEVVLKGKLVHTSDAGSAIALWEAGGGVTLTVSGRIETASNGVFLAADDQYAVNHGIIHGNMGMVVDGEGSTVENNGDVIGDMTSGIAFWSAGCELVNAKGAFIKGVYGINTENAAAGTTRIENLGTIKGDNWAFSCGDGVDHIINRGKIVGSVQLGNGQNVFDTRGGTVIGDVSGGMNGDTYLIDDAAVSIFEGAGGGYDTLKSTVSYALDANNEIEVITAIGDKNAALSGNEIGNRLNGNKGDNALKGKGGEDWLDGGKGDDVLTGGTDMDRFVFKKGGDNDIAIGFVPGEDILYVENFYLDKGYDDLLDHMTVVKGDLVIKFGKDSITLDGIGQADLAETDVIFANL